MYKFAQRLHLPNQQPPTFWFQEPIPCRAVFPRTGRVSFRVLPASHICADGTLLTCMDRCLVGHGQVPGGPWTSASPQPGGWGPLSQTTVASSYQISFPLCHSAIDSFVFPPAPLISGNTHYRYHRGKKGGMDEKQFT